MFVFYFLRALRHSSIKFSFFRRKTTKNDGSSFFEDIIRQPSVKFCFTKSLRLTEYYHFINGLYVQL